MKITTKKIEGKTVLFYSYEVNPDMAFRFSLLSEVGEPWQAEAKVVLADLCKRKNAHVKQAEFYGEPFYADVLVKNL